MKKIFLRNAGTFIYPLILLLILIIIVNKVSLLRSSDTADSSTMPDTEISEYISEGEDVADEASQGEETGESINTDIKEGPVSETGKAGGKSFEEGMTEPFTEEKQVNQELLYFATDVHYYVSSLTDYGNAFTEYMNNDDGKDIKDVEKVVDAWVEQILNERPAVVIVSGDNTLNGEKAAHEEFAKKLKLLTDDGITVLTVPGNHDINNTDSASYYGNEKKFTVNVADAEEFYEIYKEFGYNQGFSRDTSSLSYAYRYEDGRIIMMLDSAVYEPDNKVFGAVKKETLEWMERILQEAGSSQVIVVAHHNLLSESRLYTNEVTLTNNSEVIEILKKYNVNVYLSGHLHLQRIRQYKKEPGADDDDILYEAVTGAFSMYPFPYGKIIWDEEIFSYNREYVDVGEELGKSGKDEFDRVYSVKVGSRLKNMPDEIKESIYKSYIRLISAYVCGEIFDEKDFKESKSYSYIERLIGDSETYGEMEKMIKDTKRENAHFSIKR